MDVKWNLNNMIRFHLSDKGRQVWVEHLRKVRDSHDALINYGANHDMHGEMRMQCWNFIEVFGPHIGLGMGNPCDMNVILEEASDAGEV